MSIRIKKLPLRYIIYLLMLLMLSTGVSLSRYQTTIASSATVSVARPVVEYVPGIWTGNPASFKPGDSLEYTFSVRNYIGNLRTQVTMQYDVSVNLNTPLPKAFPFTWALFINQNGSYVAYPLEGRTFGFSGDEQHDYKIVFNWSSAENAPAFMNLSQEMKVLVSAYQVT